MKRYALALDLANDPNLIAEYEHWHKKENGWPEIKESINGSGILQMEIFRTGNRLFMLIDTEDDFSFEKKAVLDAKNPKVQEWEQLMGKFQQSLPWAANGEKWTIMNKIFQLE
jgi:L-rhamnose mutarotase